MKGKMKKSSLIKRLLHTREYGSQLVSRLRNESVEAFYKCPTKKSNCWKPLKLAKLQQKVEIHLIVNVAKAEKIG